MEIIKHRRNKVKREHGIIQNALQWLENLSRLAEVTDIIPGVIDVSHSSERGIVYKYETQTGCKLLLKSNGSIQEVFVVTKDPDCVQQWVTKEFPPDSPTEIEGISKSNPQQKSEKKLSSASKNTRLGPETKSPNRGLHSSKKRSHSKVPKPSLGDQKPPNVADHLDTLTLKALNQLKKSLAATKSQNDKTKHKKFL